MEQQNRIEEIMFTLKVLERKFKKVDCNQAAQRYLDQSNALKKELKELTKKQ